MMVTNAITLTHCLFRVDDRIRCGNRSHARASVNATKVRPKSTIKKFVAHKRRAKVPVEMRHICFAIVVFRGGNLTASKAGQFARCGCTLKPSAVDQGRTHYRQYGDQARRHPPPAVPMRQSSRGSGVQLKRSCGIHPLVQSRLDWHNSFSRLNLTRSSLISSSLCLQSAGQRGKVHGSCTLPAVFSVPRATS